MIEQWRPIVSGSVERAGDRVLAPTLLAVYVFFLFSRLFEAAALIGLGNLYVMMALSAIGLFVIILNGELLRTAKTPCAILLIAFTLWGIAILPFSHWRGQSFSVLTGSWMKSVAAFFIIAGLSRTFSDVRKMLFALGWGAVVSLLSILVEARLNGSDRLFAFGSLGNANEVAFHILLGLPYILLLMSRVAMVLKIPLLAFALLSPVLSLKTASREGVLIACAILLIALFRLSLAAKLKILAVSVLGGALGLLYLDQSAMERFRTLVDSDLTSSEARSAKESADARKYKLQQSIELTITNPIFGVGMGMFTPASAELSASRGERQFWIASHNSYTQISSETGLVGFFLVSAIFLICLWQVFKINHAARRLGLADLSDMSLCVLLSVSTLAIHFFFDSLAYEYYLPMIAGLATAMIATGRPLIQEAEAKEDSLDTTVLPSSVPSSAVNRKPNPYRFGRRRK
jgi:O-antigen ligase